MSLPGRDPFENTKYTFTPFRLPGHRRPGYHCDHLLFDRLRISLPCRKVRLVHSPFPAASVPVGKSLFRQPAFAGSSCLHSVEENDPFPPNRYCPLGIRCCITACFPCPDPAGHEYNGSLGAAPLRSRGCSVSPGLAGNPSGLSPEKISPGKSLKKEFFCFLIPIKFFPVLQNRKNWAQKSLFSTKFVLLSGY